MPPLEEGPPKKLTIDGVVYDVVRHGTGYLEKAMSKKQILDYAANWSTTWIVARLNPKWDAAKDPEGYEKYHSYHILFCGKASEQKFLNRTQIDTLVKSTNVGAGGPAQRLEGERMLIDWNGKPIWVAARTLQERLPRAEAAREASDGGAAAPAKKGAGAPAKGHAPVSNKKVKLNDDFFWDAACFTAKKDVRFGDVARREWCSTRLLAALVAGPARLKQDYLERIKPKVIKPLDTGKPVAKLGADDCVVAKPTVNKAAAVSNKPAAQRTPAAPVKPAKPTANGDAAGGGSAAYAPDRTHAQVVTSFAEYMANDERVPADVRAFFTTHMAVMAQMVEKHGVSAGAQPQVMGHLFTAAQVDPEEWNKAKLEACARKIGEENRVRSLAMWQAQTGTFNQLFAVTLAKGKEVVTLDDLY